MLKIFEKMNLSLLKETFENDPEPDEEDFWTDDPLPDEEDLWEEESKVEEPLFNDKERDLLELDEEIWVKEKEDVLFVMEDEEDDFL